MKVFCLLSLCCLSWHVLHAEAAFHSSAHPLTKHTALLSRKASLRQEAFTRSQRWNEHLVPSNPVVSMSSSAGGSYNDIPTESTRKEEESLPLSAFLLGTFVLGSLSMTLLHAGWQLGLEAVSYARTEMHSWSITLLTDPLFHPILLFRDEVVQVFPNLQVPLLPLELLALTTGIGLTLYILIETLPVSAVLLAFLAMYGGMHATDSTGKGIKEGLLQQQQQRLEQRGKLGDYINAWETGNHILAVEEEEKSDLSSLSSSSVDAGIQQWLKL